MKANHSTRVQRNDRAEVGIGTMIVFIAAVIVAAVAAAVLINTAGNLQRKASETGQETTQEVAANMFVRDIVGYDDDSDNRIDEAYIYLSLAPGADPVDLNQTITRWKHDTNLTELNATGAPCTNANVKSLADGYCVATVKEIATTGKNRFVLSPGDRVRLEVHLSDDQAGNEEDINPRGEVDLLLTPETGTPVDASFNTPATLGGDSYVSLK